MNYQELILNTQDELVSEILMAELAQIGYESFVNIESGLKAYIPESIVDETALKQLLESYQITDYQQSSIPEENWNAKWEAEYEPVFVGKQCVIKSSFHQIEETYPYEILINPKMSFGTGHHATTSLMVQFQLDFAAEHQNASIIDAGCGTGILAIMAEKLGASHVCAYDTDDWAVENTSENIELNHCQQITISKGTVQTLDLPNEQQIILANINRNVLTEEIPYYTNLLSSSGLLFLSGFYTSDQSTIQQVAEAQGLELKGSKTQDNWLSLVFQNTNQ